MSKANYPSTSPLNPSFSSSIHRNDDVFQKRWSSPLAPGEVYVDPGLDCSVEPSKTDQSFAKDADINNIVATYHKTGVFPYADGPAVFADMTDMPTYQEALQIKINAENAFMTLDAKTRKRFGNDPAHMLEFLEDPSNRQEAIALGMVNPDPITPQPAAPDLTGGQPGPSKTKSKTESTPVAP